MAEKIVPSIYKELRQTAVMLATPVDLDALISDGILRRQGEWYEIMDLAHLPEYARVKIRAVRAPNLVKFRKPNKKLQKFLKRGY
jgi:hypothetical protein